MMSSSDTVSQFLEQHAHKQAYWMGVSIYESLDIKLILLETDKGRAEYRVEDLTMTVNYNVSIFNFLQPHAVRITCECPRSQRNICEHGFAALMMLEDDLAAEEAGELEMVPIPGKQKGPGLLRATSAISLQTLQTYTDIDYYGIWEVQRWALQLQQVVWKGNEISGHLRVGNQKFHPKITLLASNEVLCDCSCAPRNTPLCKHGFALLMYFSGQQGCYQDVFFYLRDHSKAIADALAEYGFSSEDDWENRFDLAIRYPHVQLVPKDPGLAKAAPYANWGKMAEQFIKPAPGDTSRFELSQPNYALLWSFAPDDPIRTHLNLMTGKRKKNGELGAPMRLIYSHSKLIKDLNKDQAQLHHRPKRQGLTREIYESYGYGSKPYQEADQVGMDELMAWHREIESIFPELIYEAHYYCEEPLDRDTIPASRTHRIFPQAEKAELLFEFHQSQENYLLKPLIRVEEEEIEWEQMKMLAFGLYLRGDKLYLLDAITARTATFFSGMNAYRIRHEDVFTFLDEFLIPLMDRHEVRMVGFQLEQEVPETPPARHLFLKEEGAYLVITPSLTYTLSDGSTREVLLDGGKRINVRGSEPDNILSLIRDESLEKELYRDMQALHPRFALSDDPFFALPMEQVMQQNWFFNAFAAWQQAGFEVLGLKELKNLKYSPHRPTMRLQASSGTDWFDLEMEVHFGKEKVKLADIRKAILNKQQYVRLGDGSIGVLPEEWLKKYSSLLKVAKVNKGKLSVSQFQVSLIDELYDEIDNAQVFEEILEKRRRLRDFREIKQSPLPQKLTAELRNYQKEGYHWLNFLDEFGWGGCLADDMGLGKTVQMLAFLLRVSEQSPGATHLVVVPRSLVFNWANEVKKFSHDFTVLAHTGMDRAKTSKGFHRYDLILTTYGLVRSDIELFRQFPFHYVVLDESQAIKNPLTKTARAVQLLQAQNRLIMTGTPVENNSFDLFSQMDFVNPGMLAAWRPFAGSLPIPSTRPKTRPQPSNSDAWSIPSFSPEKSNRSPRNCPKRPKRCSTAKWRLPSARSMTTSKTNTATC